MNISVYPFTMRPLSAEEGGGWLISYPDLPGCMADGEMPEEALRNGADALQSWISTAKEFGDPVPEPGSAPMIAARLPNSMHTDLAGLARHEGVNIDTLITTLIAEGLGRRSASAGRGL